MPNRLATEKSPYLLQHANNPVAWYPWGEAAFERARTEDKPVFLSIGYSTCHWCHVMEHESFEDRSIADVLNSEFVPVKVDREERPDVDRVYMTFVQATTGSGGWPMSVWLTPDLKPFYGGTYFPPESRWGRPGFLDVLKEIARVWREERAQVISSAEASLDGLRRLARRPAGGAVAGVEALVAGVEAYRRTFDRRHGGFGSAPKFPRPSELLFLMREHARGGGADAADMALATLDAMARGGIRDHLGGGFHRYSVDGQWRVPHFEKMLYDQAQLVTAFLEAAQLSGKAFYAGVAEDTLHYVSRDLGDPAGGFFSAEDADSIPPERVGDPGAVPSEGAFYLWRSQETDRLLGEDAELFKLRYGVQPAGNATHDPHGEFEGRNILYLAMTVEEVAMQSGSRPEEVREVLERAKSVLLEARRLRPRPHLDDKILTAWNGLMIGAFARASRVLGARGSLERAQNAANFVRRHLWKPEERRLVRRYRDGDAAIEGYAEDYAFLIAGLLELFQADPDVGWLRWALDLQERKDELFWDEGDGAWFNTSGRDPSVLLRMKEEHDGAEPSPVSVGILNLLKLAHLTGRTGLLHRAEQALAYLGPQLSSMAQGLPMAMAALSTWHAGMQQIVVVGDRAAGDTVAMASEVSRVYLPFSVFLVVEPGDHQRQLSETMPFVGAMKTIGGRATAYVCRDFSCQQPTSDPATLRRQLAEIASNR
jgi:uncharacterized protein